MCFLLILCTLVIYAQSNNQKEFKNKITANTHLFEQNIDKAYQQMNGLLIEAQKLKDSLAEMKLLERKCRYFYSKNQMDSLIITSVKLQKKSQQYKSTYYEAMSNIFIAETYSVNKFYDKAINHLNNAYDMLKEDKSGSKKIFYAKSNVLNSFANVYLDKGEPKNAARKLLEEIKNEKELTDPQEIAGFQYLNYSNLSNIYAQYNIDSAYYFANKSIRIKPSDRSDDRSMIVNYLVLGQYYKEKKDYSNALKNLHKALHISNKNGVELNTKEAYKALKDHFTQTGDKDSIEYYDNKIKQIDAKIWESKYHSLKEVINKEKEEEGKITFKNHSFWIGFSLLLLFTLSAGFVVTNKRKLNKKQNLNETYKYLIDLLEKKDPAFLFTFKNFFPDFSDKLLKINPDLQRSEIEFCALLKLKLTTKEIARYAHIEPRTVQNKKYRIRKKLDIPSSVDIYNWFDNI